jgi:hypothetical protein
MRRSGSHKLIATPDDRAKFCETSDECPHQLEVLNEALAEAEDICAEFEIDTQREAHPARRKPQRISKEAGE